MIVAQIENEMRTINHKLLDLSLVVPRLVFSRGTPIFICKLVWKWIRGRKLPQRRGRKLPQLYCNFLCALLKWELSNSIKNTNELIYWFIYFVYLFNYASKLENTPAEELEHKATTLCLTQILSTSPRSGVWYGQCRSGLCAEGAGKFSRPVWKQYINGILSSSAFQRGAVHVVQMAFGHQSHPPCAACRFRGRKLPRGSFLPQNQG